MNVEKYALLSQLLNSSRLTRRQFLTRAGAAGMALGLPPVLSGCGGSPGSERAMDERTLIFNLSHLAAVTDAHVINIAGKRFPLTPIADAPHVLARASQSNAFLNDANVARQITHHVESVSLPSDAVMLAYLSSMEDPEKGTWQMNMIHLVLPQQAHQRAYAAIRAGAAGGFPHSAKRMRYGLPAASSARELMEESMLIDVSDHAQTLIGMHAELASLDPETAAQVHGSYIAPSGSLGNCSGLNIVATCWAGRVWDTVYTPRIHPKHVDVDAGDFAVHTVFRPNGKAWETDSIH
jgi:hypothetical protein